MTKEVDTKDDKDGKRKSETYASFGKRFVAYILDILVISLIASLVCMPFINTNNQVKLEDEYIKNTQDFFNNKLSIDDYHQIQVDFNYRSARETGLISIVSILISILYFGVLQFYMKGQTLGKKAARIKVKSDDGDLSMNQLLLRALIIDSIVLDIVLFASMLFMSKSIYYYSGMIFETIQYIIYIICVVMIIKNKKGKGLHDVLFHTSVVNV